MPKGDVGYDIHKRAVERNKGALKPYEKQEKTKAEIKERGGPPGYPDKSKTVRTKPMGESYYDIYQEGLSIEDQMKVSQEYFKKRNARSPEEKEAEKKSEAESRAKRAAMHKKPDPYKPRAGESD